MSWAVGFDSAWNRDVGYGVPAICDFPGCGAPIDRGLGCVCGGEPYGGERGCGLFFCEQHLYMGEACWQCERCLAGQPPFEPTPDTREWMEWKLTDESWGRWRNENPAAVSVMEAAIGEVSRDRRYPAPVPPPDGMARPAAMAWLLANSPAVSETTADAALDEAVVHQRSGAIVGPWAVTWGHATGFMISSAESHAPNPAPR